MQSYDVKKWLKCASLELCSNAVGCAGNLRAQRCRDTVSFHPQFVLIPKLNRQCSFRKGEGKRKREKWGKERRKERGKKKGKGKEEEGRKGKRK